MAVVVVEGNQFDGVEFGTAPGTDQGYVIGYTPLCGLLFVDEQRCPATLVGVKYYHHAAGDARGADRPADDAYALTMLVSDGRWRQRVWNDETGISVEVVLQEPGDFVAWRPGLRHSWFPERASSMLTVRWKLSAPSPAAPS